MTHTYGLERTLAEIISDPSSSYVPYDPDAPCYPDCECPLCVPIVCQHCDREIPIPPGLNPRRWSRAFARCLHCNPYTYYDIAANLAD